MIPTILYLDNSYIYSLEMLKNYFSSNLSDMQKKELLATFRDGVLVKWLEEGKELGKDKIEELRLCLEKQPGNSEAIAKIAEIFGVQNISIKSLKFADHAEFVGCTISSVPKNHDYDTINEINDILNGCQSQNPEKINDGGIIRIKKRINKISLIFQFKLLIPENDFLSLRFVINPQIKNAIDNENLKLDLRGKQNSIKNVTLNVDCTKLCKECQIVIYHGDNVIGSIILDNHENTDKVIETTEEIVVNGNTKANIVARVWVNKEQNTDVNNGHNTSKLKKRAQAYDNVNSGITDNMPPRLGFFDNQGNRLFEPELKMLKNSMYPDLDFGFYYKKIQEKDNKKISLYHINENGYKYLGDFFNATPLNDDLVAVRKTKDSKKCGIIDRNGKIILEDNKVGQIYGINKANCLVCEVRPNTQGLTDLNGNELKKDKDFNCYYVGPNSNLICAYDNNHIYYTKSNDNMWSRVGKQVIPDLETINYVLLNNDYVFINGYSYNDYKIYFEWFDYKINRKLKYIHTDKQIQVWSKKPVFPIIKNGNDYSAPVNTNDRSNYQSIQPVIITDSWILDNRQWCIYKNNGSGFEKKDFFKDLTGVFLVFSNFKKQKFIGKHDSDLILGTLITNNDELRYDHQNIPIKNGLDRIVSVVSCGNYITIAYMFKSNNGDNTQCSVIINQEGKVVFEDEWGDFPWVCGLINNQLYYLKNGELYCMNEDESNKKQLSNTLKANELYQLGTTNHFVVKYAKEYQIIDAKGQKLGNPFEDFDISISQGEERQIMDYIYNSERLPIIRNGKHGLIDTNGKDIVPCEYDKVEDLNSVFKQQGIIFF